MIVNLSPSTYKSSINIPTTHSQSRSSGYKPVSLRQFQYPQLGYMDLAEGRGVAHR